MTDIQHLPGRILHTLSRQIDTIHTEKDRWRHVFDAIGAGSTDRDDPKPHDATQDRDKKLGHHSRQLQRAERWTEKLDLVEIHGQLTQLAAGDDQDAFFSQMIELQKLVTVAREIWEFYRDRFELYYSPLTHYADWIKGAEWVAADCYKNALRQAKTVGIPFELEEWESPLLQLSTAEAGRIISTPVTWYRGMRILRGNQFYPVPVIVLPADLMSSTWGFLSIHHEVGHDVDADLGAILFPEKVFTKQFIHDRLAENIVQMMPSGFPPNPRQRKWIQWAKEMFADFFAILNVGPAFVSHMIDVLAWPRKNMFTVQQPVYPPTYLRILILIRFLETLEDRRPGGRISRRASDEYKAQAAAHRAVWESLYLYDKAPGQSLDDFLVAAGIVPPKSEITEKERDRYLEDWESYQADIDTFIEAMADKPFTTTAGGREITLRHLGTYTPRQHHQVMIATDALSRQGSGGVEERISPCLLPAAARFAFERLTSADPPPDDVTATLQELNQHVLRAIEANRPSDVLADEREDAVTRRMATRAQRLRQFIQSELASE